MDGVSMAEEQVLDALGNHTDGCLWVGSAGDDLQFKQTRVFANGQVHTNAEVLALLRPPFREDVV